MVSHLFSFPYPYKIQLNLSINESFLSKTENYAKFSLVYPTQKNNRNYRLGYYYTLIFIFYFTCVPRVRSHKFEAFVIITSFTPASSVANELSSLGIIPPFASPLSISIFSFSTLTCSSAVFSF